MHCVRIRFTKTGQAKYISHLDLMRFMTRAVRRAGIPLWYTEGFNPHPYMTFALPLSLGTESFCEAMDIRVTDEITDGEIRQRLESAMPPGMEILRVGAPERDAKEIAGAGYRVVFTFKEAEQAEFFLPHIRLLLGGEELIVLKRGKSGRKKVDKPVNLLEHLLFHEEMAGADGLSVALQVRLVAGNTVNINPSLLTGALLREFWTDPVSEDICRMAFYTAEGQAWN